MLKRALGAVALSASMILTSFAVPVTATPAMATTSGDKVYRIMPVGDSITRGGGQVKGKYVGYRAALQANLKAGATGFRYDFVGSMNDKGAPDGNHEGHGGWTIDDLSAHIDDWLDAARPDIVLLHAGTNNITKGDSPEVAATKLQILIAQIRRHDPDTKIFVAKVIKSRDPNRRPPTNAYQALIPDVVAAAGDNVYLVDQTTVSGTDIYDWTHPNDFGYAKMAYNWYTAMDEVLAGGAWKNVRSPYQARKAEICQVHYSAGNARVCRVRPVN
jgi:lysophospholipase L1-like esterase